MTIFKLDGSDYRHPDTCSDVTIQQVIEFYRDVYPTRPGLMIEILEAVQAEDIDTERVAAIEKKMQSKVWISSKLYPYMQRVVNHFCGVPTDIPINPAHLEYLYGKCIESLSNPGVEYKKLYTIDGEVYELPDKLMAKSTLQEFAEAAQYEENAAALKDGQWEGMLNVASVVLRKQGEEYNDEVYERNRRRFRTLPLRTLYEIAFFLSTLSKSYELALSLSLLRVAARELEMN